MPAWILATFVAATAQAARMLLLKKLSAGGLSAGATTFARFVWAPPILLAGLALAVAVMPDLSVPPIPATFWPWAVAGGVAQIVATACVVLLFAQRVFAVGIAFSKTTVLMTLLAGWLVLGETVSAGAVVAIVVGFVGVVLISVRPDGALGLSGRATALGLGSGAAFAVSAVGYRAATLALDAPPLMRAAVTLVLVTMVQTAILGAWLAWRDRAGLAAVVTGWRRSVPVAVLSLIGSLGWFTAFTLQNAGLVNAVGQVELILSIAISVLVLGERIAARELAGIVLLGGSVAAVVLIGR